MLHDTTVKAKKYTKEVVTNKNGSLLNSLLGFPIESEIRSSHKSSSPSSIANSIAYCDIREEYIKEVLATFLVLIP